MQHQRKRYVYNERARAMNIEHPNIIRYDGTDILELRWALERAYERSGGVEGEKKFKGA